MMQINLTGFLNGKNAREFMGELWPLLLSAQENIAGIPTAFLELKKEEIKQRQVGFFEMELWVGCEHRAELVAIPVDILGSAELCCLGKALSPEADICWCWTCIFDKVCVLSLS